jgi:hypothetical protein
VPGLDAGRQRRTRAQHAHFATEFRIDGQQSQFGVGQHARLGHGEPEVHQHHDGLSFRLAVDVVEPDLRQHDGTLAFKVGLGAWMQDDAWFGGYEELVMTVSLTAYVLCFEPRAERPKPARSARPGRPSSATPSRERRREASGGVRTREGGRAGRGARDQTRC